MKKLGPLLFSSLLLLLTTNAYADVLRPQLANFSALTVSGHYNINVVVGKTQSVQIDGDAKQLANVQTSVSGNTLAIATKEYASNGGAIDVTITVPQLTSLGLTGANQAMIHDLANDAFSLKANGDEQVILAGNVKDFTVDVAGDVNLDASKLIARKASINAQGNVQLKVYATDELRTHGTGNVSVSVLGSPKVVSSSLYGNTHVQAVTH